MFEAMDCLRSVMEFYIEDGNALPEPSEVEAGDLELEVLFDEDMKVLSVTCSDEYDC